MRKILLLIFLVLFALPQDINANIDYDTKSIIVATKQTNNESIAATQQILANINNSEEYSVKTLAADLGIQVIEFSQEQDIPKLIKELENQNNVRYAEPNFIVYPKVNDPYYFPSVLNQRGQWHLHPDFLDIEKVWSLIDRPQNTNIFINDSGVNIHPDLEQNIRSRANCQNIDCSSEGANNDNWQHGTLVAGIISSITNNSVGISSSTPNHKIHSIRISDGGMVSIVRGLDYIYNHHRNERNIVNMSYGTSYYSQAEHEALNRLWTTGTVLIAAADNNNQHNVPDYPNGYNEVIGVGSINPDSITKTSYSNSGVNIVGITTYGGSCGWEKSWCIVTTEKTNNQQNDPTNQTLYAHTQGNSFSSPIVAGIASLVWTVNPELTNYEVRNIIENTADKIPETGNLWKHGRLNPYQAVLTAKKKYYDLDKNNINNTNDVVLSINTNFLQPTNQKYDFNLDNQYNILDTIKVINITHLN